jgi:hypothetical protein
MAMIFEVFPRKKELATITGAISRIPPSLWRD